MNDKTKLVKEAKNDKASCYCWSAYQKRLGKMGLGEMRLGEMLPNRCVSLCFMTDVVREARPHQSATSSPQPAGVTASQSERGLPSRAVFAKHVVIRQNICN